jgi:hypothetical protein
MENQKISLTIALFVGLVNTKNGFNSPYNMLETFPKPAGVPPVMSTSVRSSVTCVQCIRSGWVWCSNKWHYSGTVSSLVD